jgi:hypothetical protein
MYEENGHNVMDECFTESARVGNAGSNLPHTFLESSVDIVEDKACLATSLVYCPQTSDSATAVNVTEQHDCSDPISKLYVPCWDDAISRSLCGLIDCLPCCQLDLNTYSKCKAVIGLREFELGWDPPLVNIIGDSRFGFG